MGKIARSDVADFMLAQLADGRWMRRKPSVMYRARVHPEVCSTSCSLSSMLLNASTVLMSGCPLPKELQRDVVYTGSIGAATKQPDAAKACSRDLTAPAAPLRSEADGASLRWR
jgi:hypothetical protein